MGAASGGSRGGAWGPRPCSLILVKKEEMTEERKAIVSFQNSAIKYKMHQYDKKSSHLTIGLDGFELLSGS